MSTDDATRQMGRYMAEAMKATTRRRNGVHPRYADTPAQRQIAELQRIANEGLAGVRRNTGLTDLGKRQAIARGYKSSREEIDKIAKSERAGQIRRYNSIERQIFGATTVSGANAEATRNAASIADNLDSASAANDALDHAELNGDDTLARAVAHRAWQSGWTGVVDRFTAGNTSTAERLNEMADLQDHLNSGRAIFSALPLPSELRGHDNGQIAELAKQSAELNSRGYEALGKDIFLGLGDGSVTPTQAAQHQADSQAQRLREQEQ